MLLWECEYQLLTRVCNQCVQSEKMLNQKMIAASLDMLLPEMQQCDTVITTDGDLQTVCVDAPTAHASLTSQADPNALIV